MHVRLEKIDSDRNQRRFYSMRICKTLFGEWCLIREWGRLGNAGGQCMTDYAATKQEAITSLQKITQQKTKRGYGFGKV